MDLIISKNLLFMKFEISMICGRIYHDWCDIPDCEIECDFIRVHVFDFMITDYCI